MHKNLLLGMGLVLLMVPIVARADFFENFDEPNLPYNTAQGLREYDPAWTTSHDDDPGPFRFEIRRIQGTPDPGSLHRASSYPYYLQFANPSPISEWWARRNFDPAEVLAEASYAFSIDPVSNRTSEILFTLYQDPNQTGPYIGWGRCCVGQDPNTPDDPNAPPAVGDLFYTSSDANVGLVEIPQPVPPTAAQVLETKMTFTPTGFHIDLREITTRDTGVRHDPLPDFTRHATDVPYPGGFDPTKPVRSISIDSNGPAGNDTGVDDLFLKAADVQALPGDFDGNGVVDADDIDLLCDQLGADVPPADEKFDLNGDGMVNSEDADKLILEILATEYGDADLMGGATLGDLGTLAGNFTSTRTDFGWADGDFNWDGLVTLADLGILAANFGSNGPIGQAEFEEAVADLLGPSVADLVPEPATFVVLGVGALTMLRRRRPADCEVPSPRD